MKSVFFKSRKTILLFFDLLCFFVVNAVYILGVLLDGTLGLRNPARFLTNITILLVLIFTLRIITGFYKNVWRYVHTKAYLQAVIIDAFSALIGIILTSIVRQQVRIWYFVVVTALFTLLTLTSRYVYRTLYKYLNKLSDEPYTHKINVAIVGAGQIGALLADELRFSKTSSYNPIAFIDKDDAKRGGLVSGIKVYIEDDKIVETIKQLPIQEIFIALPGLDSETLRNIYQLYSQTGCKIKLYDTPVREMDEDDATAKRTLREFSIEDLLFRKPININNRRSLNYYKDKVVLVTGGGGSIGSELCRQIAKCSPKKLIIVDIYENNAYDIQQQLIREYGNALDLTVFIASVRDVDRLDCIFNQCRPDIVFHAAAHKHVPLMENNPCETIKNNVLGTYNTANAAEKYGVEKFIMISTDKAVNPTNIMGASKRMGEMIVQCRRDSQTSFAAVRFGNVLGSNGSVIPLFKSQIAKGGPITLTDKRIIRYFMTIPEASQLVIQAGAMAKKGQLFVLDMGKPVKIYDLAVNMIKLSGLVPEEDIKIEEIGLRPGEKLFEELLIKTETLEKTDNDMIFIETDTPYTREEVDEKIAVLVKAVEEAKDELIPESIMDAMKSVVPTFHDPREVNENAAKAEEMKEAEAQ
ncbi:MAG: polysaccharide biosynthesis protein [Ruminococcaceae bacterium]|nr:polysaccharide biosynthesis protein [Oscillospiraceae bacterium]